MILLLVLVGGVCVIAIVAGLAWIATPRKRSEHAPPPPPNVRPDVRGMRKILGGGRGPTDPAGF